MPNPLIVLHDVSRSYPGATGPFHALSGVSLSVDKGEFVVVVGQSGSGKSTLLALLAGIDRPTQGTVIVDGTAVHALTERQMSAWRGKAVGIVFQFFQLLPTLTALENVLVPLELRGQKGASKTALALLDRVGLADRAGHYPAQLSGGEQQRVSLARAFANRPAVLFADEPTGNLDPDTSERVVNLLFELNREAGTTLVLVTHDLELAAKTQRTLRLRGGRVVEEVLGVNRATS